MFYVLILVLCIQQFGLIQGGGDMLNVAKNAGQKSIQSNTEEWSTDMNDFISAIGQNYMEQVDYVINETRNTELRDLDGTITLSNQLNTATTMVLKGIVKINTQIDEFRTQLKEQYDFVTEHYNIARFLGSNGRNPNKFDYKTTYVWAL